TSSRGPSSPLLLRSTGTASQAAQAHMSSATSSGTSGGNMPGTSGAAPSMIAGGRILFSVSAR
ncbi:unnamed protein product, partial [Amoebophrya sp. A25]